MSEHVPTAILKFLKSYLLQRLVYQKTIQSKFFGLMYLLNINQLNGIYVSKWKPYINDNVMVFGYVRQNFALVIFLQNKIFQ